jgi:hypothetical protein
LLHEGLAIVDEALGALMTKRRQTLDGTLP